MIKNPFLSFVIHNDWLHNHCWLADKCMTPSFVVVVNVLLQICRHVGTDVRYLHILLKKWLGAMTDKWV